MKNSDIFLIFARGIDCGEFPRSVFWGGNKKIMYAPVKATFTGTRTIRTLDNSDLVNSDPILFGPSQFGP